MLTSMLAFSFMLMMEQRVVDDSFPQGIAPCFASVDESDPASAWSLTKRSLYTLSCFAFHRLQSEISLSPDSETAGGLGCHKYTYHFVSPRLLYFWI